MRFGLRWGLGVIWLLMSCLGSAQLATAPILQTAAARETDPSKPPPPIIFAPWQEVEVHEDGTEYLETFPSAIVSQYPVNNTVPLHIFIPDRREKMPVVLVLHYWGATDLKLERVLASELNRRGIIAAIMTLPYHLSRTPAGHKSGALAIQPEPDRLKETMLQSVLDARRALDFLVTRPEVRADQIGISGTSLGAIVTGLVSAVDPRIYRSAFLLGGVNLAHIVWTSSLVVSQREAMRRKGITEESLRADLEPIEPLAYLHHRHPQSSFVVGGRYDTVIPQDSTEDLITVLQTKNVLWLDTGHYGGIFVQRRLMREVASYFGFQFSGSTFLVPDRLYAPTVRVAIKIDTFKGLDVGAGLDLYRFDRHGESFLSLLLTPRGPQLFLGHQLFQGVAFGLIGSSSGVGASLLWSSVL
jgi:Prolyl oligopeptidase family